MGHRSRPRTIEKGHGRTGRSLRRPRDHEAHKVFLRAPNVTVENLVIVGIGDGLPAPAISAGAPKAAVVSCWALIEVAAPATMAPNCTTKQTPSNPAISTAEPLMALTPRGARRGRDHLDNLDVVPGIGRWPSMLPRQWPIAPVMLLLAGCSPAAIAGLVVAIDVDAVDGLAGWAFAHVGKEVLVR
mgnify:CR=1 FL=1